VRIDKRLRTNAWIWAPRLRTTHPSGLSGRPMRGGVESALRNLHGDERSDGSPRFDVSLRSQALIGERGRVARDPELLAQRTCCRQGFSRPQAPLEIGRAHV